MKTNYLHLKLFERFLILDPVVPLFTVSKIENQSNILSYTDEVYNLFRSIRQLCILLQY